MKKSMVLALFYSLWFLNCKSSKVGYNMPPDLSDADKKEFVSRFNHGVKLYNLNCQKCHSGPNNSNEQGPNFTNDQIKSYEAAMRIQTPTHEFAQKLSAEDIDDIIIYLKFKKL